MTLDEAIEIVSMMTPVRSYDGTGGLWLGKYSNGIADAAFEDWGAARATSVILNAVQDGRLVRAPERPKNKTDNNDITGQ